MSLTFMTTQLLQFPFAVTEQYRLVTLTCFETWDQRLSSGLLLNLMPTHLSNSVSHLLNNLGLTLIRARDQELSPGLMLTFMAVHLLEFRFAVADQHRLPTEFGHHWFHVARVHDHSHLPVPWWCLQCQMRWPTPRPVSNSKKQFAATGILNGLALGYLSTILPVVGLDITFLIAQLCVASSAWHWEPWVCLAH